MTNEDKEKPNATYLLFEHIEEEFWNDQFMEPDYEKCYRVFKYAGLNLEEKDLKKIFDTIDIVRKNG